MGYINGAPSKRCIKRRLSTTSTALPTSSARSVAAKKFVNGMPRSCSVAQRVNRTKLKPKKKKMVGGSTCFTCTSHHSKARRQSGGGAPEAVEMEDVMAPPAFADITRSIYYQLPPVASSEGCDLRVTAD